MSEYAIFFQKGKSLIQLPVNPEELEVSTTQAFKKYEILKHGQIAIPTHMELKEYSFEAELPYDSIHYIESSKDFHNAEECLKLFDQWRKELEPIQFIAGKVSSSKNIAEDAINTPVLIESLTITEKAGEERDKYVSFKLIEYKDYSAKKKKESEAKPTSNGYYTVKKGDTLWAIAKKYYGKGTLYTKIYNANKDKIKNPNLIYADQRLVIPK
jgi:LysM repeat protein